MDGGYSEINFNHSQHDSRSMEFSDPESNLQMKNKLDDHASSSNKQAKGDEIQHQDCNNGNIGTSHVVLKRNCSVSSSSGLFQSSVKGAISSMRRSSSTVSERYSRIHDQSVTNSCSSIIDLDDEQGDDRGSTTRSNKKRSHKGGKILKACKHLFGLH